jgi:hypothetical protein
MPAAPPTALDSREAELFAGREAELRLFVARFEPPPAPDERRVLLFTGVGRLGKSALARAIQRRLEEIKGLRSAAWAAIDFADAGGTDPVQACLQIRLQLGATLGPGVRFPVFDTAFARYHAKRYPGSDIRSQYQALNPNGELVRRLTRFLPEDDRDASLWQDLADGVAAVAEGVPLLGLGYKRLNQFAHWTQEQWDLRARGLLQDIDAIGADAIALRLPRCLGADLEAAVAGMKARVPIAIIGDTTEAFHRGQGFQGGSAAFHNDAWLRELIWHSPGVLFVLLGRDPLEWHRHEHRRLRDWGRIVETQPVARLTDTEARGILERFPVPEAEIRDRMVAGFAGLPFYLGLQLDLYIEYRQEGVPPSPDAFGGAPAEIVTRFLSHLDPGVKHTLETLAHARLFDDALHRELRPGSPELVSEARLGELTRFSFVEPAGEGTWRLHQLMRDILRPKSSGTTRPSGKRSTMRYSPVGRSLPTTRRPQC